MVEAHQEVKKTITAALNKKDCYKIVMQISTVIFSDSFPPRQPVVTAVKTVKGALDATTMINALSVVLDLY